MQGGDPVALQRFAPAAAHHLGDWRERREAPFQRPEIEAGPAGDDRSLSGAEDLVDGRVGEALILADRALVVERPDRHEPGGAIGLVGEDRQAAVGLHRVRRDDLSRDPLRERLGHGALSRGGRAEDREDESAGAHGTTRSMQQAAVCLLRTAVLGATPDHHPLRA